MHAERSVAGSGSSRYVLLMLAWLAIAIGVAGAGLVTPERRLAIPAVLLTAVATLIVSYRRSAGFGQLARTLDLRWILALHVLRAPIGAAFLLLMHQGRLTPEFAVPAGWGDIVAGLGALALLPLVGAAIPRSSMRRRLLAVWNVIALADIVFVVMTAQRIAVLRGDFDALSGLVGFPGLLLPLFLVPLVVATHVLIIARLRLESRDRR